MIGVTKRVTTLDAKQAREIVDNYRQAYHRDDMTLLVVSAYRAVNFLETWLALEEEKKAGVVKDPAL